MIIDFHAHVGDLRMSPLDSRTPVTWENLLRRMDREQIDRAAVLPVYNASPEGAPPAIALLEERMSVRDQVLDACRFPDRIIPFGNMDPRWLLNSPASDFGPLLAWFTEQGCVGVGEVTANIPFDDPRTINMFQQCGRHGLLVTIESTNMMSGQYGLQDDPGMPRLERLLLACPDTIIIAHGPGFWAEVATPVSSADKAGYPGGLIENEGAVWRLLRTYPNLYADLSARSGLNALTRDTKAGVRLLSEFSDRLIYGTDICFDDSDLRGVLANYLRALLDSGQLSEQTFDRVTYTNALGLLGRNRDQVAGSPS